MTTLDILELIKNIDLKNLSLDEIWKFIEKIITELQAIWQKSNKKLIGNIAFWMGIGFLIHDYMVEQGSTIDPFRCIPHGGEIGTTSMAFGIGLMLGAYSGEDKIKATVLLYGGLGGAWLGWSMRFFGRSAIFWIGIASMIYGWYLINREDLGF